MHRTTTDHDGTDSTSPPDEHDERLAYSVPAAAKLIGMSARRTWDLVKDKRIKSFREGHRRLISRRALEAYVAEREADTDEAA